MQSIIEASFLNCFTDQFKSWRVENLDLDYMGQEDGTPGNNMLFASDPY